MKKKNRKPLDKERVAEDYCFHCKDGGDLLICDYKDCLKVFHFNCVGKDESFARSGQNWKCNWHFCLACGKESQVHCYCCPKAVCFRCISYTDFVKIRGKYGFCNICLKLAILIEEDMNVDSDGENVDFKDRETYEGLFMEYYKIIKAKEGIKVEDLHAAKNALKMGKNLLSGSESGEFDDEEDEESNDESMNDIKHCKQRHKKKVLKVQPSVMKKNGKSNRMQFSGWGSNALIEFLKSIGRDTDEKLSQHDVSSIITAYIGEHSLFHPGKKRMVVCDEKLRSIFKRKTVNRNRIYDLLELHFADNLEESEEEEEEEKALSYSGDENQDPSMACKMRKKPKIEKANPKKEAVPSVTHSNYASVVAKNIKLVYLRRSIVHGLSKQPESFEKKMTGSFVRVKSDPNDIYQRNSHQLVQVTGVKKVSSDKNNTEIILLVSSMPKEINMSLLSDADFSQEECEDLQQKVKDGLIQRPTVIELQEKAWSLHEDITNDLIARELKLLDRRIDQANEKGWRRELFEYRERKKQLEMDSVQSEMLKLLPTVEAELIPSNEGIIDEKKGDEASPHSVSSIDHNDNWGGNGTSKKTNETNASAHEEYPVQKASILEERLEKNITLNPEDQSKVALESVADVASFFTAGTKQDQQNDAKLPTLEKKGDGASPHSVSSTDHNDKWAANGTSKKTNETNASAHEEYPVQKAPVLEARLEKNITLNPEYQSKVAPESVADVASCFTAGTKQDQQNDAKVATLEKQETLVDNVIELTTDDSERKSNAAEGMQKHEDPESCVWIISGPSGERKGAYSLSLLKRWSETSNYAFKFKVWKEDQSEKHAIWLKEAINLAFASQ